MIPGSEVTSDTLLLSDMVSRLDRGICFDLGTGTGEVFRNAECTGVFCVGLDNRLEPLLETAETQCQGVLCPVENVTRVFREGCADMVVANPPFGLRGSGRRSPEPSRDAARSGDPLTVFRFIHAGRWLLKKGGVMYLSSPQSRVEELSSGMIALGFGGVRVVHRRGVCALTGVSW